MNSFDDVLDKEIKSIIEKTRTIEKTRIIDNLLQISDDVVSSVLSTFNDVLICNQKRQN